tara:strand:- start:367 stop:594 length:228 start_codon:yes stop_codon:yes gene_type:complete
MKKINAYQDIVSRIDFYMKNPHLNPLDKISPIDRERVISEIQRINCEGRNSIRELANLDDNELSERLEELTNYIK